MVTNEITGGSSDDNKADKSEELDDGSEAKCQMSIDGDSDSEQTESAMDTGGSKKKASGKVEDKSDQDKNGGSKRQDSSVSRGRSSTEPAQRSQSPGKKTNIILIGMTGCGKSKIGWLLAQKMGLGFIDTDDWIEKKAGKSIKTIFDVDGESHFRKLESQAAFFLTNIKNHVISIGGGFLESSDHWQKISSLGIIAYLDCPVEELVRRLANNSAELRCRPLLADLAEECDEDLRKHKLGERLEVLRKQRQSIFSEAKITLGESFSTLESSSNRLLQEIKMIRK